MSAGSTPVGRDTELSRIRQFLGGLLYGSRTLLLEGEAGIGKSTIIASAAELATEASMRVLRARPVEAEMPLEFTTLADLLDGVPESAFAVLPDPQLRALRSGVFRDESADAPVDARSIATATLTIARELAKDRPLLLIVDDIQWLDAASQVALSFAIRRAGAASIGLLAAVRTEWSQVPPISTIDDLEGDRVERLRVGPLSVGAIRVLLSDQPELRRAQLLRVHETSGGNPMFAKALAAEPAFLADEQSRVPVGLPQALRNVVLRRIAALEPASRDLLLVAALSTDSRLSCIAAASVEPTLAPDSFEALARGGILEIAESRVAFAHPLIRSVTAAEATPAQRRAVHRRLADAVERPEARARHMALAAEGPDTVAAAALEDAARTAGGRGASEVAAELAELAVSLTAVGDADAHRRRVALEAEYRFENSDPERAHALVASIVDAAPPGAERASLVQRLGRYAGYGGATFGQWRTTLEEALPECGDDGALRASILLDIGALSSNLGDVEASFRAGYAALEIATRIGDIALSGRISAGIIWISFMIGRGAPDDLVALAEGGAEQPPHLSMELRPNVPLAHILHLTDRIDDARALYEIEFSRAVAQGVETGIPVLIWGLIEAETYAGNWDRAHELLEDGYRRADESDSPVAVAFMTAMGGLLNTLRGRVEVGLAEARKSSDLAVSLGIIGCLPFSMQALALARLSVGDARGAHEVLQPYLPFIAAAGIVEPGVVRFVPDDVEALVRLGDIGQAEKLLAPFERIAVELERGWARAVSLRCRALIAAATGDFAAAEVSLEYSLALHRSVPFPFDHARTLLIAGEINRRARHKKLAGDHLTESLAIFRRLGSPLWEARAREELQRIGVSTATGPVDTQLTPAEWRVAQLVAAGLSNARVAEQLFMGQRTVESHLSHIFRKLGVRSRTEMSSAVGALARRSAVP